MSKNKNNWCVYSFIRDKGRMLNFLKIFLHKMPKGILKDVGSNVHEI